MWVSLPEAEIRAQVFRDPGDPPTYTAWTSSLCGIPGLATVLPLASWGWPVNPAGESSRLACSCQHIAAWTLKPATGLNACSAMSLAV